MRFRTETFGNLQNGLADLLKDDTERSEMDSLDNGNTLKVVHHRNVTGSRSQFNSYGLQEVLEKEMIKGMKEKMEEIEGELVRNKAVIEGFKKRENVLRGEMVQRINALRSEFEEFKKRKVMEVEEEEKWVFKLYDIYEKYSQIH